MFANSTHPEPPNSGSRPLVIDEPYYTVAEVAQATRWSRYTVVRRFSKMEGVIDLGQAQSGEKRRYRQLRIPRSVLLRFLQQRRIRTTGFSQNSGR